MEGKVSSFHVEDPVRGLDGFRKLLVPCTELGL